METKLIKFAKYFKVHFLNHQGLNFSQIANRTQLNRRTVSKYISMTEKEFCEFLFGMDERGKILTQYENEIKEYLISSPTISSKRIYDKLINKYNNLKVSGKTVFNFVKLTREKYNIRKNNKAFDKNKFSLSDIYCCRFDKNYLFNLISHKIENKEYEILYKHLPNSPLRLKKRSFTIICHLLEISKNEIIKFLDTDNRAVSSYISMYNKDGTNKLFDFSKSITKKTDNPKYKNTIFKILHEPPKLYGLNRTTWKLDYIKKVMSDKDLDISIPLIRQIIKEAGYSMKKARKVLTSNDPEYRTKLEKITSILRNLKPDEKFFSIDEYGPFAIKMQGGKSYTKQDEVKTYPQWQKSRGSLILTAALELSTNQMTYFYSDRKNTKEMIKLMDILLDKYKNESRLFISWDAASWHISKELYKKVDESNSKVDSGIKCPKIELCPLPACAQFLNVIESIFSGMSRAIIHNSNYQDVNECKEAINKYFEDRNQHFILNPQKAGNKIWGKERVVPKFNEGNNCKDPRY
jgi:transposase